MMEEIQDFVKENPYLTGGLATVSVLALYLGFRRRSKNAQNKVCPPNTVLLHTMKAGPRAPSMSPFPVKLECYMRLAKIPYMRDFSRPFSPKGKIPWITYNGEDVSDSSFIIQYLNKKLGVDLNQGLNKEQRAIAKAIQVLVEEQLYWCMVYFRWICSIDSEEIKFIVDSWLVRRIVGRKVKAQLHACGIGRHSHEEIVQIFLQDLQVLQDYLGNKPFMMGSEPTEVDCCVFSLVCNFIFNFSDSFVAGLVHRDFPGLYQYTMRMKDRVFPGDWQEACKAEAAPRVFL